MKTKLIGIISIIIGLFIWYKITRPGAGHIFDDETDFFVVIAFMGAGVFILLKK